MFKISKLELVVACSLLIGLGLLAGLITTNAAFPLSTIIAFNASLIGGLLLIEQVIQIGLGDLIEKKVAQTLNWPEDAGYSNSMVMDFAEKYPEEYKQIIEEIYTILQEKRTYLYRVTAEALKKNEFNKYYELWNRLRDTVIETYALEEKLGLR